MQWFLLEEDILDIDSLQYFERQGSVNSKEVICFLDKFLNSLSLSSKTNIKEKRRTVNQPNQILFLFERLGISIEDFEFINVVGTSGKGSVTMMLSECLFSARESVGAFFSPHVSSISERFWFNGSFVEPKLVAKIYNRFVSVIKNIVEDPKSVTPTFFESTFALFLLLAKESNCKILVLEAGIGGKYDVTRIPFCQKLSVITKIALDHTEILGKNVSEISRDKAAIIAENGQVLVSKNHHVVRGEISKIAKSKSAKFYSAPVVQSVKSKSNSTSFNLNFSDGSMMKNLSISMHGEHQLDNAAVVVGACKLLGLDELSIVKGLAKSRLPGRIEIVSKNPSVILDIAHNPNKIKALMKFLRTRSEEKIIFIIGFLEGKDFSAMIEEFSEIGGVFFFTSPPTYGSRRNISLDKLNNVLLEKRISDFKNYIDPCQALKDALRLSGKDDLIVVTGSSYLVGELRKFWFRDDIILQTGNPFIKK